MNEFISAFDAMENAPYGAQKAVRDEVADMKYGIRRTMDAGLPPDDMAVARAAADAVDAADEILEKIFN